MLALILISFVLTGVTAFYNFKSQNEEYNIERFRRKERAVQQSMGYFLTQRGGYIPPDSVTTVFSDKICELADVHSIDINLFDLFGNLLITSRPFDQAQVNEEIEYTIFKQLTSGNSRAEIESQVGGIPSILAYWYFADDGGRKMAITNVQYNKTEVNKEELSSFLIQLTQIYVVLFVGAAVLAFFLSNYITKSLQRIGRKMQQIRVGEQNDPLTWHSDDEIGALVQEYNHMLQKVEQSAELLAKSEREIAWREMAKQVAHEIKNPLTPMKLRIQHMQRAWDDQAPGFEEKMAVTCKTLVEQIDSLAHIADEFSNFAAMPRAHAAQLDLIGILRHVMSLFEDEPGAELVWSNHAPEAALLMADKDQLLRAFTNLIKNAFQAIPADQEGRIEVELNVEGDYYRVDIRDNGTGIPEEAQERIFVPNFTTKSTGTGLGLAMVKNTIESSGGRISFETKTDVGTVFTVKLPIYSTENQG